MCSTLRLARAKFVTYTISKNAEAMLRLAETLEETASVATCQDHQAELASLVERARNNAEAQIRKYFPD